eukprot:6528756-Prymnesium_polylepis.1
MLSPIRLSADLKSSTRRSAASGRRAASCRSTTWFMLRPLVPSEMKVTPRSEESRSLGRRHHLVKPRHLLPGGHADAVYQSLDNLLLAIGLHERRGTPLDAALCHSFRSRLSHRARELVCTRRAGASADAAVQRAHASAGQHWRRASGCVAMSWPLCSEDGAVRNPGGSVSTKWRGVSRGRASGLRLRCRVA